jgi:hypothetical protein
MTTQSEASPSHASPEHQRDLSDVEILANASDRVFDWQVDPDFYRYAKERVQDIDIDGENGPNIDDITTHLGYWEAFGTYAAEQLHGDDSLSDSEKQATLLLASAPEYALAQHALEQVNELPRARKQALKTVASEFNGQIRALAEITPDLSADRLKKSLAKEILPLHPKVLEAANNNLDAAVRGAQHEMAVEQILQATEGITSVIPAETEDDLKGVDFFVILEDDTEIAVDAKASQARIEALKRDNRYVIEQSSRPVMALKRYRNFDEPPSIVINSQVDTERNLGDRFRIRDPETIRIRSQRLKEALEQIPRLSRV